MSRFRTCLGLAGGTFLLLAAGQDPSSKRKALIIEGQSNHADWPLQTRMVRAYLEQTGLFSVQVATTPPEGADLGGFRPRFADFDVVLSLYNGAPWPDPVRREFVSYVRDGGGFVSIHMADNAFPDWEEYNRMIGLGGWYGRNERSGPYVYFDGEKFVRDVSPGPGGGHGVEHAFQVTLRDVEHPVTRGLPPRWMHERDELYDRLRGPAENVSILATAYSDRATGGTGRHEPVLLAIPYGKGRVFHTTLGHGAPSRECAGFIVTLQRGAEWAAAGKVTQPVPADFPAADSVRVRPFEEHQGAVLCLALSADGKMLASAGEDRTVRIWDGRGTTRVRTLRGHTAPVTSLAFSPDGASLISSARTVRIWEVGSGKERGTLGADPWAEGVAVSPDGTRLATAGESIGLWNIGTRERTHRFKGFARRVAFSPDGRTVAAAGADGEVRLHSADGAVAPAALQKQTAPIDAIAFRGDGKMAVSGGRDGVVRLWDLGTRACVRELQPRSGWINDVAFSPDGRLLAVGHRRLTLWDVETGRKLAEIPVRSGPVNAVAFSPDGKRVAFGGGEPTVGVREVADVIREEPRR